MEDSNKKKKPSERPELKRLETLGDGTLVIRTSGRVGCGSAFTRLVHPLNQGSPEYILGQMALEAGYHPFEDVQYELRIKPKRQQSP